MRSVTPRRRAARSAARIKRPSSGPGPYWTESASGRRRLFSGTILATSNGMSGAFLAVWPGLAPESLVNNQLQIDTRKRLKNQDLAQMHYKCLGFSPHRTIDRAAG